MTTMAKERRRHVEPLVWNAEGAAARLGISVSVFLSLRKHPLYRSDVDKPKHDVIRQRTGKGPYQPKPLWSDELINFILFSWRKTRQGIRRYDDDQAWELWNALQDCADEELRRKAGI